MTVFNRISLTVSCLLIGLIASPSALAQKPLAIKAGKIITMAGDPIEDGVILMRDGRITDVGKDLQIPVDARILDASDKVVMPGFVEPHSSSGMSQSNETNPLVPYVSVLDSIDPMDSYFRSARRSGVTSVAVTPGNSTIIGGQAAVIKTGGEFVDEMVVKPGAGIKISMRPVSGSRMSHLAKLRKALDDAKKKLVEKNEPAASTADKKAGQKSAGKSGPQDDEDNNQEKQEPDDADKAESTDAPKQAEEKPESELDKALFMLLSGELPAIIYCEKAMDVGQALRLIETYGLQARLVLDTDCYKSAEQVAKSGLPVILDSTLVFWEEDPRTQEETKIVLPRIFRDHDVKFAFQVGRSSSNTLGSSYLWYQAATAMKYGMPEQEALEALTILPAKFLGVDKFVGSIEPGKDGDILILSGHPLQVDTWVEKTIVNGEVVYDKDEDEQLQRLLGNRDTD